MDEREERRRRVYRGQQVSYISVNRYIRFSFDVLSIPDGVVRRASVGIDISGGRYLRLHCPPGMKVSVQEVVAV